MKKKHTEIINGVLLFTPFTTLHSILSVKSFIFCNTPYTLGLPDFRLRTSDFGLRTWEHFTSGVPQHYETKKRLILTKKTMPVKSFSYVPPDNYNTESLEIETIWRPRLLNECTSRCHWRGEKTRLAGTWSYWRKR